MVYGIKMSSKPWWIEWLSVEAYIYVYANDPPNLGFACIQHSDIRPISRFCPLSLPFALTIVPWKEKNHSLLLRLIVVVVVYSTRSYFIADCLLVILRFLLFACTVQHFIIIIIISSTTQTNKTKQKLWIHAQHHQQDRTHTKK